MNRMLIIEIQREKNWNKVKNMDSEMEKLNKEFTPGGRRRSVRGCRLKKDDEKKVETELVARKRFLSKTQKKKGPVAKKTKTQSPKKPIEPQKKPIEPEKEPSSESDLSDLENSDDEWKR